MEGAFEAVHTTLIPSTFFGMNPIQREFEEK